MGCDRQTDTSIDRDPDTRTQTLRETLSFLPACLPTPPPRSYHQCSHLLAHVWSLEQRREGFLEHFRHGIKQRGGLKSSGAGPGSAARLPSPTCASSGWSGRSEPHSREPALTAVHVSAGPLLSKAESNGRAGLGLAKTKAGMAAACSARLGGAPAGPGCTVARAHGLADGVRPAIPERWQAVSAQHRPLLPLPG